MSDPSLAGRVARCSCGQEAPSSRELFGFEYLGPDSREARETCKHCRYNIIAHEGGEYYRPGSRFVCEDFQPIGPRHPDRYYCGCRGWD